VPRVPHFKPLRTSDSLAPPLAYFPICQCSCWVGQSCASRTGIQKGYNRASFLRRTMSRPGALSPLGLILSATCVLLF
jgi:hypothetical protein